MAKDKEMTPAVLHELQLNSIHHVHLMTFYKRHIALVL
jgi:hypothetical protein